MFLYNIGKNTYEGGNMIDYELSYSLKNKKVITIIYMKGLDVIQRNIQVLKIDENLITAIDLDKKGIRTFKKDKILSALDSKLVHINENNYFKDKVDNFKLDNTTN